MTSEGDKIKVNDIGIDNQNFDINFSNETQTILTPTGFRDLINGFIFNFDDHKYQKQINKCIQENKRSVIVNYRDVYDCSDTLSNFLVDEPQKFIIEFNECLKEYDRKFQYDYFKDSKFFQIRISNFPTYLLIRDIDIEQHRNQMVTVRGYVINVSDNKPYIYKWCYMCGNCQDTYYSFKDNEKRECPHCIVHDELANKTTSSYYQAYEDGNIITNSHYLSIQELNDDLKGSVPQTIDATCLGDVAKLVRPGERINAVGFIRLAERRGILSKHTPYKTFFMINNIESILSTNAEILQNIETTKDDIKRFKNWVKDRDWLYNKLIASYAPHIYGLELSKLVALITIVGGSKIGIKSQGYMMRDRINVLWVGDPSTGKTEIMKFGSLISVGSIYVSGRGASGKGLTALTLRNGDGTFTIQPGAVVLANGSILWFDEADKTDDETRSHLHECMESGTVSLTKGGQIATLKAETTVNFGANPIHSRYLEELTLIENIKLPISLLTRFDIVQVIKDVVNKEQDRKITDHISYILRNKEIPFNKDLISLQDLIKYINWVKESDLEPIMTNEAQKIIQDFYDEMRLKSTAETIGSTPRQYQGSWRFCTGLARMLMCTEIDAWIANKIIQMLRLQFDTVFKDKDGNFNIQQMIGRTTEKLKNDTLFMTTMKYIAPSYDNDKIPVKKIKEILIHEHGMSEKEFKKIYDMLSQEGSILHVDGQHVRFG